MTFSLSRAVTIARREYLTTVRRKAFVFSVLLTPALMFLSIMLSKSGSDDARAHARQSRIVALVDSSGALANAPHAFEFAPPAAPALTPGAKPSAPPRAVPVTARAFASQEEALDSLRAGSVNTVIVIGREFLANGAIRRYELDTRAITWSADDRALRVWLTRSLLANAADSARVDRVVGLGSTTDLYVPDRTGAFALKDDGREMVAFLFPFALALLLGMAIVSGGQYLLQGVSEEKESRILESMLCMVTPDELILGKLVGLGGAGLTLVGVWIVVGLAGSSTMLAAMQIQFPPMLIAVAVVYFLFGYLFYASLMTGIGAVTNNLREAQQLAMIFTMMNFIPFYALTKILNSPNSGVTIFMSMFPPTAPTTMLMRVAVGTVTGQAVPLAQVAGSLALLGLTAFATLAASSKLFRLGLLLYGKTPNLPEIMKILRQK